VGEDRGRGRELERRGGNKGEGWEGKSREGVGGEGIEGEHKGGTEEREEDKGGGKLGGRRKDWG